MAKTAIIVVDMLNDFVYGALQCDNALRTIKPHQELLEWARNNNIPVIFSNDSHLKGVDHELKLWGDHAIRGTKGAEVIPELKVSDKDYIVPKRRYSGFFQTDMDILLKELGVTQVIMTGLHTHMCVRHTSADAYQNGLDVIVAKECTASFTDEAYQSGLTYLKETYGAKILSNQEIFETIKE